MELQIFGPGPSVPVVGQGTWQIVPGETVVRTLQRGIDLGMTHIDTAELYTGAEELVGKAIRGRREEIFLVSKVKPSNASRRGVIAACERSLKKLGTDYLDVFLLHWNEGTHTIADTMAGMRDLVWQGKIRHVGVSNFAVAEMEEAVGALDDVQLACNQVLYHLGDRGIEDEVIPWCESQGVAVVGYSPFLGLDSATPGSAQHAALTAVATRTGRTIRQVVLRYLTRCSSVFAIPKASTLAHVEENAEGQGFDLSAEDVAAIEAAFPR